MHVRDRFRGCLLAGAIGDALGAPVEFWSLAEIRARIGPEGVTGFVGGEAAVTDDTQMTLFTAEGLIRASVRARSRGICHPPSVVHHAYLRWLYTQGVPWAQAGAAFGGADPDGWLALEQRLHRRRAPGNTCLSALQSGRAGSIDRPLNDSKGCGGVMRAAPVGLLIADPEQAFQLGCEVAALTHGHPSGWLPAGVLAAAVALVVNGEALGAAVDLSRRMLASRPASAETTQALDHAVALAGAGLPSPEDLERLGSGWVGPEALAIAVCCALAAGDGRSALLASVNHSGDSDSTGAICGNLVGAVHGREAFPPEWASALDVADIVTQVADDLWRERFEPPVQKSGDAPMEWWQLYPGW